MTARFGEAVLQMKREGTGTATERLSLTALKAYLQDAPNEVAVNAITALSASPVQLTLLPAWVAVTPGLMQALLLDATRIWARLGTSPDNLGLETACTYLVHSWAALDYNTTHGALTRPQRLAIARFDLQALVQLADAGIICRLLGLREVTHWDAASTQAMERLADAQRASFSLQEGPTTRTAEHPCMLLYSPTMSIYGIGTKDPDVPPTAMAARSQADQVKAAAGALQCLGFVCKMYLATGHCMIGEHSQGGSLPLFLEQTRVCVAWLTHTADTLLQVLLLPGMLEGLLPVLQLTRLWLGGGQGSLRRTDRTACVQVEDFVTLIIGGLGCGLDTGLIQSPRGVNPALVAWAAGQPAPPQRPQGRGPRPGHLAPVQFAVELVRLGYLQWGQQWLCTDRSAMSNGLEDMVTMVVDVMEADGAPAAAAAPQRAAAGSSAAAAAAPRRSASSQPAAAPAGSGGGAPAAAAAAAGGSSGAAAASRACAVCSVTGEQLRARGASKLLRCSRCKCVFYCSADCQRTHWPQHKAACQAGPAV